MKDQKRKGRITELQVYAKLLQYGEISIPYGNNCRYDCILDIGIVKKVYTPEQVDFIATIWKDQLLLIPVTGENKSIMYISEIYPDNGIKSTVNLVQYFLPEIQLKQYL